MKNKITVPKVTHYTIVEMMMVIAVFMIILSMTIAAWLNSNSQASLKNAVRLVSNQLNLARAKAVSERKPVGVYFTTAVAGKPRESYAMLVCYEGDSNKPLPGCSWERLPGSVVITEDEPSSQVNAESPGGIVFKSNGSIAGTVDKFYVVNGNQDEGKSSNDSANYYEIKLDLFTGRIQTIYHED